MATDYVHASAVVRVDEGWSGNDPNLYVTVIEVMPSVDQATEEAVRLNALNGDKGAYYFVQATRWYPQGRSVEG